MLNYTVKFGDPLEEYFYEKMIFLNRCKITGKEAVDCILFGIEDRSVRTGAEAVQFTEPDKLLVYLRSVKSIKRPEKRKAATAPDFTNRAKTKIDKRPLKCFNCGEENHPSFKCPHPKKKCTVCLKLGHMAEHCFHKASQQKPTEKTVL